MPNPDIQWLHDCGWSGWLEDTLTGEIVTENGDTFKNAGELRRYLMDLNEWPDVCKNFGVPARLLSMT